MNQEFYIGQIFEDMYPKKASDWCNVNKVQILEIEPKDGVRRFAISEIPEITEYEKAQRRISELKRMLADSDYVVIKIAEGVATADDYSEILNSRKAWRAEINELELVIDNTNTAL